MKALLPRRTLLAGLALGLSVFAAPALAQEIVVVPVRVIYPG
jgi:hypothetical protein